MPGNELFHMLWPVLSVRDLEGEKQFYLDLGFRIEYEGEEFPGFVSIAYGECVEFGLEQKDGADIAAVRDNMLWQFGTRSLNRVIGIAHEKGYEIVQLPTEVKDEWDFWEGIVRSPNGYDVLFSGAARI